MDVTQPASGGKTSRRAWIITAGALATLAALYTGGWHVLAGRIEGRLLSALAGQDEKGLSVDCRNMKSGGFPFSLSLHCSSLTADDVKHGISTTLGTSEARVSLLSPNSVHSISKGPVEIRSSRGQLVGEWQALTSDVDFGLSGMQTVRVDATGLKANFTNPGKGSAFQAKAEHFSGFADGASGDLATGVTMEGAILSRNGAELPLPPLKIDASLKITEGGDLVGRFDRQALYGRRGEIERFAANLGEGRDVIVTGPFAVDEMGRISGKLQIEARNVQSWLDAARQALPEADGIIQSAGSLIRSYTKGNPDLSIDLTLKRGKVLIAGFIPVGEIPPL